MAGYLNRVSLIGYLGNDPEVRTTQSGSKIVTLSVATTESWTDKRTGERRENTEWHRVVIFNENLGDVAERFLAKGSKVMIEGKLQTRKWTDTSGIERYSTEIVLQPFNSQIILLDRRHDSRTPRPEAATANTEPSRDQGGEPTGAVLGQGGSGGWSRDESGLDDDIPF